MRFPADPTLASRLPTCSPRLPARRRRAVVAAILAALHFSAAAEKADKDKPTNIVFSHAAIDDLKQTQLFTGDVVLTKGTILMRSDKLSVRQDPENYSAGTALMTQPGKLAYYKQKREGIDEDIEGQAERIDFDEKSDLVTLTGRSVVRRLGGTKVIDEARGNVIEYNNRTESYTVIGNAGSAAAAPAVGADGSADTRGRVTFQPKSKRDAGAADPTAAAPKSPPLDLKASPGLVKKTAQ